MRNSTYFRFFTAMAVIVFISFLLLGALSTVLSYRRSMSERREIMIQALIETARYIQTQHLSYSSGPSDFSITVQMTMTSRITGLDILLTDANGVVLACSEHSYPGLGNTIPDEYMRVMEPGRSVVTLSPKDQAEALARRQVAGVPLVMSIGGELRLYGYLFVASDMSVSGREWRSFTAAFLLLALNVMLLTFAIAFVASKKQTAPIVEMASAARRFARGEYDVRVKETPQRKDEIEQLAKAFNFMAESMQNNELLRREFIANLSHELKTPMTVISGFAEGLLDGTIPPEDEKRYLEVISSETKRLSRLVRTMLDVSTLGETSSETMVESSFDISEVVRLSLLGLSSRIEEKQLDIEAELPDDPVLTKGNKDAITQVVYNLIDNSVKYSHPGGVIRLELWQQEKRVFVSITNYGETIPADELPHIFQRFHKIDKSRSVDREGVGLGLYIVKTILDKMGEDIYVTSADGETKFIFSLTLAQ